jgi:hypothetical protein
MMPRQVYKWAVVTFPSLTLEYYAIEDHRKEMMMLKERFRKAPTLPCTQKNALSHSCLKRTSSDKSVFRRKYVQHHTYSTHAR